MCKKRKDSEVKTRIEYLTYIYEKGSERVQKEFSVERLLTQLREIKVFLKKDCKLTDDVRYNL